MSPDKSTSLHLDDEAIAWATRLDGGNLSPAELATLDAWLARDSACRWRLAHYQQLFAQLHGTLPAMAAAGVLSLEETPAAPVRRWGRLVVGVAMAAAVAAGAILWIKRPQEVFTDTAQRQSITLADGTRTDLNARTRLTVDLRRDRRLIRLEQGEAVFTVTKDPARPFFVETAAGTVRVTGTVFDVRAAPSGSLAVTVLEGRVLVQPVDADGRPVDAPPALLAGDQLNFDPATGSVQIGRPASVEDVVAWREGKVVFAGTPLREALERFADYHGRSITVAPEAAGLPLGGRYTLDDLDHFIVSLELALPVRVLRRGDGSLRVVAAPRAP
jgi:transmembrane sensor